MIYACEVCGLEMKTMAEFIEHDCQRKDGVA